MRSISNSGLPSGQVGALGAYPRPAGVNRAASVVGDRREDVQAGGPAGRGDGGEDAEAGGQGDEAGDGEDGNREAESLVAEGGGDHGGEEDAQREAERAADQRRDDAL